MEELRIERRPELERPVLIAAFRGWNDGAEVDLDGGDVHAEASGV